MSSGKPEALREACATGDVESVAAILQSGVNNVNDQHAINGWTALHWATKRGHRTIVELLMKSGADPFVTNFKEESPSALCTSKEIASLLGSSLPSLPESSANEDSKGVEFVPNYIKHPPFPYANKETNNNIRETTLDNKAPPTNLPNNADSTSSDHHLHHNQPQQHHQQHQPQIQHQSHHQQHHHHPQQPHPHPGPPPFLPPHLHHPTCQAFAPYPGFHPGIFVLKVRIADQLETDFIEVEFPRLERDVVVAENVETTMQQQSGEGGGEDSSRKHSKTGEAATAAATAAAAEVSSTELLTFDSFVEILCDELRIPTPNLILKIRKLPDTIVRKSRDVHRLKDFQEIEVVLSKKPFSETSPGQGFARPFESSLFGYQRHQELQQSNARRSSSSSSAPAASPATPSTATILY